MSFFVGSGIGAELANGLAVPFSGTKLAGGRGFRPGIRPPGGALRENSGVIASPHVSFSLAGGPIPAAVAPSGMDYNPARLVTVVNPAGPVNRQRVDNATTTVGRLDAQRRATRVVEQESAMTALTITATRIYVMSAKELQQMAVVNVTNSSDSEPNGVNDTRMGVVGTGTVCRTCDRTTMDCPGHIGQILFPVPILHPKMAQIAVLVLMSVCNCCGKCLLTEESVRKLNLHTLQGLNRLKAIAEQSKTLPCSRSPVTMDASVQTEPCIQNPQFFPGEMKGKDRSYQIQVAYKIPGSKASTSKSERVVLEVSKVKSILEGISADDRRLLGLGPESRPENWVLEALAVIPPATRPYVYRNGQVIQNDLTTKYITIINECTKITALKVDPTSNENALKNAIEGLNGAVDHLMDNGAKKSTSQKDQAMSIKGIKELITGKESYIRGNTMGKRVDFSGRSVLGPENRLRFGQMRFPKRMGRVLTTPVVVTSFNLEEMQQRYREGRIISITRDKNINGRIVIKESNRNEYILEVGDMVERHGENGDESTFNRQPTLHKQSFMAYDAIYEMPLEEEERVHGEYKTEQSEKETIGLLSAYTTPANADFDGDEGNKHKHQTIESRVEARLISHVGFNVMNAQSNRPIMGLPYHTEAGAYMLTFVAVSFTEEEWQEALRRNLIDRTYLDASPSNPSGRTALERRGWTSLEDRLRKWGVPSRSGHALFSTVFPPDFYYEHAGVQVREGVLLLGSVVKDSQLGPSPRSFVHYLWKLYTNEQVRKFFTEAQWMCDWALEHLGLTIGYYHCVPPNAALVEDLIAQEMIVASATIEALGPVHSGMSAIEKEFHEKKVRNALDNVTRIGRQISIKALAKDNPLNVMAHSGAKGKDSTTAQTTGILGQQFIKGERAKLGMTRNTRALLYFPRNSEDIEARGFVRQNFMTGTRPAAFCFHMAASRIGLIDTAVTTADSGAIHHRMVKVLEDVGIKYDGSVRNAADVIFQFSFSDGFNAGELIPTKSGATGDLVSFVDLRQAVGKLNLEHGYNEI